MNCTPRTYPSEITQRVSPFRDDNLRARDLQSQTEDTIEVFFQEVYIFFVGDRSHSERPPSAGVPLQTSSTWGKEWSWDQSCMSFLYGL